MYVTFQYDYQKFLEDIYDNARWEGSISDLPQGYGFMRRRRKRSGWHREKPEMGDRT